MSYVVDKNTLLFDPIHLDQYEAGEIEILAREIILNGRVDYEHPAWKAWAEAAGFDTNQQLLTYSIVFPQRALLSVVDHCHFKID